MNSVNPYGFSFIGKRANNEDSFRVLELTQGTYFIAVADGMGGAEGGEIASSLILMRIEKYLKEKFKKEIKNDELKIILSYCFDLSQEVIREKLKEEPNLRGMGTTLTCAIIRNGVYVWGNIGDSRLYLINKQVCTMLTHDHTYLYDSWKKGEMEMSDENVSKHGHIISRVIDGGSHTPDIYPEIEDFARLNDGEMLIACSDGAIINKGIISTGWLFEIAGNSTDSKELIHSMINFAFNNGSTDNITAVVYDKKFSFSKSKVAFQRLVQSKPGKLESGVGTFVDKSARVILKNIYVILLIILAFGSGYYWGSSSTSDKQDPEITKSIPEEPVLIDPGTNNPVLNTGSGENKKKYFNMVDKGENLLSEGKLEEARKMFLEAGKFNPSDDYCNTKISEIESRLASKSAVKKSNPISETNSTQNPAKQISAEKSTKTDSHKVTKTEEKTVVKPEIKSDEKTGEKTDTNSDTKANVKTNTKSETKTDTSPGVKVGTKTDIDKTVPPENKADAKTGPKVDGGAKQQTTDVKPQESKSQVKDIKSKPIKYNPNDRFIYKGKNVKKSGEPGKAENKEPENGK